MAFCHSFINELYRHVGADIDVPAGDIGVGGREIGYIYGQYRKITGLCDGSFTGKGIPFGGSLARREATGYGLVYLTEKMLESINTSIKDKTIAVSGAGNVAIYAAEKAIQLGAKVVTMSDSDGFIYDTNGIDINTVKQIKEASRGRIKEYLKFYSTAQYFEQGIVWSVPCDVALPCATQNELTEEGAEMLVKNGCIAVAEGSNMSTTIEAVNILHKNNILYVPGKASNAGGVAVSALEMAQNSARLYWPFEDVDHRLQKIMHDIYTNISETANRYGMQGNLVAGANIAGFKKVADAMLQQGVI